MEESVAYLDNLSGPPSEKKPPRKPRPSEIAAKLAREKAKQEAAKPKAAKPKAKKKSAERKTASSELRSERLDMRLTKAEKKQLQARAKRLGQSVTSILIEAIKRLK